ncbi:hypothetical protein J3R83DRAFT_2087 [Lanmaoa asiatica]|nr:hypothetical protein J3R83DRAFT_2087 [Lanmaoa asiatica]
MKHFFARHSTGSKPPAPTIASQAPHGLPGHDMATGVVLQPSFVLPPIPHPHPYEHIAIVATDEGLVMRPHLPGLSHSLSYVRLPWGKHPKVQELQRDGIDSSIDWKSGVVVHGIVGIMDLFNGTEMQPLVITARSHVGSLFDENHSIYSVKSVRAIPLTKDRAQHVLDTIANHIPPSHVSDDVVQDSALASQRVESTSNARVKFADENDVKIMSPTVDTVGDVQAEESLSSLPSSGTSTPTSSESLASPSVVKVIADRMSFWTRLSRRQPTSTHDSVADSDEHQSLDSIIQSAQGEPAAVIDTIIASTAPPPDSVEERHTELEDRVVRECVREYVKGCMYFAYHFVNLTEQTGKESTLTNAYKSYAKQMENKDIRYCEYDFHHETRGMKYENISKLIDDLERTFESQGCDWLFPLSALLAHRLQCNVRYFWISDHMLLSKQKGIFRVNCIDCLDRTNVVQSAFARHVLGIQLEAVGLTVEPQNGRSGMDIVFNDGLYRFMIHRTSGLTGNIGQTGKRDLGGLFHDGVNSLARMYSATFSDWFCQAVIDFMLGYRTISVFSEFLLKLQSTDPRELIRLSRVRAEAIATSVSRVLDEREPLLAGVDTHRARATERQGAYILSPLEEASRDPTQNAGFSVTMAQHRSHSHVDENNKPTSGGANNVGNRLLGMMHTRATSKPGILADRPESNGTSFAAFKALPVGSTHVRNGSRYTEPADDLATATSCEEAVDLIVDACQESLRRYR